MQTVMKQIHDNAIVPAGPLEIIAAGGLNLDDIQKILSLTVREAHLASLFETLPDVTPGILKRPHWKKHLAEDCSRLLENHIVVK